MPGSASGQGEQPANSKSPVFATTHWSVVLSAGAESSPAAHAALERLCSTYWYPLYAYTRRRGYGPEDAEDLTQGFFARLLARKDLAHVHPQKGRFRSFLLASLQHYLADEWDKASASKRGGEFMKVSFDAPAPERRYQQEPADDATPERVYERQWARMVLEQAEASLSQEFAAADKSALYQALKPCLAGERPEETYAQVAARLGKSETAIRCGVQRLRQRYAELIRAEVAHTVASPGQIEEEIRHLLTVLGS